MPARRAHAAPPLDPPADRVERRAEDGVEGVGARGELRHVGLPDRDRPGRPDALDDQLVGVGHVVGEQRGPVRRPPPPDVVGVLERERETVQGAECVAPGRRLVRSLGAVAGAVLVQTDDGVELRVAVGDALQVEVEQLARGDLHGPDGGGHRARRRVDVQLTHPSPPSHGTRVPVAS
jgi:hypothetical protein